MAKKDKNQEIVFSPDTNDVRLEDEPLFEAEAYASPQPEAGSDVTVTKPVGIGGPVPIVAPKHNTIQLQPIVVPLAVVPYMTQDSSVLRTDGRSQGGYAPATEYYDEATDFETVSKAKIKKKAKSQPRIFALITMLLSLIVLVPFIIAAFKDNLGDVSFEAFNVVGIIKGWVDEFNAKPIENWAYLATAFIGVILAISSLISLICGKYARAFNFIMSFLDAGAMVALLVAFIVGKNDDMLKNPIFIALVSVTLLNMVLVIIFSLVLNKLDDKVDESNLGSREI